MAKEGRILRELKDGNINLVLNSYEDIFSDFDPRSVNVRALSDDFLEECKKIALNKGDDGLELILSIPKSKRNSMLESRIKKRLKEHFKKHSFEQEKLMKKIKRNGLNWIMIGIIAIVAAIFVKTFKESALVDSIIEPLVVIPGWFAIWEGLARVFVKSQEQAPNHMFYKKMSEASITFTSYCA